MAEATGDVADEVSPSSGKQTSVRLSSPVMLYNGYTDSIKLVIAVAIKLVLVFVILQESISVRLWVLIGLISAALLAQAVLKFGGTYLTEGSDGYLQIVQYTVMSCRKRELAAESTDWHLSSAAQENLVASTFFSHRTIALVMKHNSPDKAVKVVSVSTNLNKTKAQSAVQAIQSRAQSRKQLLNI